MKIGILIKKFEDLANWELRIINEILINPNLDLSLLILDGRKDETNPSSFINRCKRLLKSKNIIGRLMFNIQKKIELILFKEPKSISKKEIKQELNKIDRIFVKPTRKGYLDIFLLDDVEKVKGYNLDIILRHEFNIIRGEILDAAKYGIWSLHHGDNSVNRGGPPAFWEIVLNHAAVGVTLQKITNELDGGYVIDKAYYNTHWSFVNTSHIVFESSVSLLLKNIKKTQHGDFNIHKSPVYFNKLYKIPNIWVLTKYILMFYFSIFKGLFKRIEFKIFGTRHNCWTLFIGKGNFLEATLFRLKPVPPPKNEFWADPFIFNHKNSNYIFFENFNYKTKKGKISCGKIFKNQLSEIVDVMEKDYHLSFPSIFKHNQEIFLMSETEANNQLELYKCVNFPNKWELFTTAFEGEKIMDPFFYRDKNNVIWLFLNKEQSSKIPMNNSELYIYRVNSMDLKDLDPHRNNPVIIDSRVARNGGMIFEHEKEIYRPSQANIHGYYGRALNVNKIIKLTIDDYIEETIVTAHPNFSDGLVSMHHLHQVEGLFVIDAAYNKK